MRKKDSIDNELDILTNEEIEQCDDLQKALALINKEQVVPESIAITKKNFIVEKNKEIKDEKINGGLLCGVCLNCA